MGTDKVTREMKEAVAMALLYRDDPIVALRKVAPGKPNSTELSSLYRAVLSSEDFEEIKKDIVNLEEASLINDSMGTIMLQYNKLLRDAQYERKYEVAARILKEIRQLKAIENEEMRFEIIISVKSKPDEMGENQKNDGQEGVQDK